MKTILDDLIFELVQLRRDKETESSTKTSSSSVAYYLGYTEAVDYILREVFRYKLKETSQDGK